MPRTESHSTALVQHGVLYTDDPDTTGQRIGGPTWFAWLATGQTFSFAGCTFRPEARRRGMFWYAYRKIDRRLRKVYAGRSGLLTLERLDDVAAQLNQTSAAE